MLALEVHFDVKWLIPTFGNKPSFQCKFYKTMFKNKNTLFYNMMMNLCLEYIRKELLKMYPTITKFETKELTRLGEKHGKTLPNHPIQEIMLFCIMNFSQKNPPYGFFAPMYNLTKISF